MIYDFKKILVIQNAFIGDAILGTAVLEKLHQKYENAEIHYLVRKGAESLFHEHPFLKNVYVFDRSQGKWKEIKRLNKIIRNAKFDLAITLQRFGSSGYLIARSGAKIKAGFSKNPFSILFNHKIKHEIGNGKHEIERNQMLIEKFTDANFVLPKLYPTKKNNEAIQPFISPSYITISPASVWYTKQFPKENWVKLINKFSAKIPVYLLGSPADIQLCTEIIQACNRQNILNLAGKIALLSSAALMEKAQMNYTNDSAPLHLCTAMNAPVKVVFCSTVPEFGFGPIGQKNQTIQTKLKLDCRPCGLHGHKSCPKGHFNCALTIETEQFFD